MKFRDIIRSTNVWWRNQANWVAPEEDFLERVEKHMQAANAAYYISQAQKLLPKAPRPEGGAEAQPVGPPPNWVERGAESGERQDRNGNTAYDYQFSEAQRRFYDESEPF